MDTDQQISSASVNPTTVQAKKISWSELLLVLFVALFSGVIFCGIGYFIGINRQIQEQKVSLKISPSTLQPSSLAHSLSLSTRNEQLSISSWQTYKDNGFQFQYPSTWKYDAHGEMVYNPTTKEKGGNGGGVISYAQSISFYSSQSTETAKQYVQSQIAPSNSSEALPFSSKPVTVNGIIGEEYTTEGEGYAGTYLVLANGKTVIDFGPLDDYPSKVNIINMIIGSLKFT